MEVDISRARGEFRVTVNVVTEVRGQAVREGGRGGRGRTVTADAASAAATTISGSTRTQKITIDN